MNALSKFHRNLPFRFWYFARMIWKHRLMVALDEKVTQKIRKYSLRGIIIHSKFHGKWCHYFSKIDCLKSEKQISLGPHLTCSPTDSQSTQTFLVSPQPTFHTEITLVEDAPGHNKTQDVFRLLKKNTLTFWNFRLLSQSQDKKNDSTNVLQLPKKP